jgi:phosphate transport system permease protein
MNNNIKPIDIVQKGLAKRYRAEKCFRLIRIMAMVFSMICLASLFISIFGTGYSAFQQTVVELDIFLDPDQVNPHNLANTDFNRMVRESLFKLFPEVKSRKNTL